MQLLNSSPMPIKRCREKKVVRFPMATFIPYPETVQFRDAITYVNRHMQHNLSHDSDRSRTLKFLGTVKLHGTHAAIVYQQKLGRWCESRNRILSITNDNAGFAQHMDRLAEQFLSDYVLFDSSTIRKYYEEGSTIVIHGEWCGADVQDKSNVAICSLPKMFVIFKIKIICERKKSTKSASSAEEKYKESPNGFWLEPKEWSQIKWHEKSIYNIYEFPTYEIDIDFHAPDRSQDQLTKLTEAIDRQCPVGAHFGQNGCGEGIVWVEWQQTHGALTFKVKGPQHRIINSDVLVPIQTPKMNSMEEFVDYACTKNRMQQAYHCLEEEYGSVSAKDCAVFIRWLVEDIIKEERETMDESHIDRRDLTRAITSKAEKWFNEHLMENRKRKGGRK